METVSYANGSDVDAAGAIISGADAVVLVMGLRSEAGGARHLLRVRAWVWARAWVRVRVRVRVREGEGVGEGGGEGEGGRG